MLVHVYTFIFLPTFNLIQFNLILTLFPTLYYHKKYCHENLCTYIFLHLLNYLLKITSLCENSGSKDEGIFHFDV